MSLPAKQMLGEVQMLDTKLKANEQCTEKIVQQFTLLETRLKAMQQVRVYNPGGHAAGTCV